MKEDGGPLFTKDFNILEFLGHGSYGYVYKIEFKGKEGEYYALKKIDVNKAHTYKGVIDGIETSGLREIIILKEIHHENIERLYDTFYDKNNIYMILEYAELELFDLIGKYFKNYITNESDRKNIFYQILQGVAALHKNGIMHRDICPNNILIDNKGQVKIADFGLARLIYSDDKKLTGNVTTLQYKAPEIFFGATLYGPSIDIWSLGCVFGETILGEQLFKGREELEVLTEIFFIVGRVGGGNWDDSEQLIKFEIFEGGDTLTVRKKFEGKCSAECINLLEKMLALDPLERDTAEQLLKHPYFTIEEPLASKNDSIVKILKEYAKDGNNRNRKK